MGVVASTGTIPLRSPRSQQVLNQPQSTVLFTGTLGFITISDFSQMKTPAQIIAVIVVILDFFVIVSTHFLKTAKDTNDMVCFCEDRLLTSTAFLIMPYYSSCTFTTVAGVAWALKESQSYLGEPILYLSSSCTHISVQRTSCRFHLEVRPIALHKVLFLTRRP